MMKPVRSEQFYEEQLRQRITEKEKEMTSTLSEEERQVLGEEISQPEQGLQVHPAHSSRRQGVPPPLMSVCM